MLVSFASVKRKFPLTFLREITAFDLSPLVVGVREGIKRCNNYFIAEFGSVTFGG